MVQTLTDAWNRNDGAGFARAFADDAEFINVRGDRVHGRAAIERIHAFIFAGPYRGSHMDAAVDGIARPAPTVAVVETTLELTHFNSLPPGLVATAPGLLRTRMRLVIVRGDGGWTILAAQNTAVSPQPMAVK